MGLLISCWFIIESVLIPQGFAKWYRLSFFIHPLLLVFCQLFLLAGVLVRWASLIVVLTVSVVNRTILAGFRSLGSWVIGLVFIVINRVRTNSAEDDQHFQDCQSWEDQHVETEGLTRGIVPCDQWYEADHEPENPCRSIARSYYYASFPLPSANTLQQNGFMEEACFEQAKSEGIKGEVAVSYADEEQQIKDCSSELHQSVLPAPEVRSEELKGVVFPALQISASGEGDEREVDSTATENERCEEELDGVSAFCIPRLPGKEGAAEEPADPAAFIDHQYGITDQEELEECEAAPPVWPISRNEDGEGGGAYDLQAPAGSSLAIRGTERNGQHDIFYKEYMEKMGWFDRLNSERIGEASAILNMDIEDPSFLEKIEAKITSLEGFAVRNLIKSIESDLERVYVAQSCLGWAALHHQYRVVESLASSSGAGLGFSCVNAGKLQQFRVVLERYVENECKGAKRFWNYSRSRFYAVNLLQVPEVSVEETTTANDMLEAIEKAIQVFLAFLESDNCRPSGKLKKLLWIDLQAEDPRDLHLLGNLKKQVYKKEKQVKDLQRTRRRWWKKTTPGLESQGIEILFSLIDVKLASRVLRMSAISTHQLEWCQHKLESMEISKGRVMRSSHGTSLFPSS